MLFRSVLTLCIRLFSELVQGRYSLPLPDPAESRLAQHMHSVLEENINLYKHFGSDHLSAEFNSLILPQSQLAIDSIGHAMAYSAAVEAGLPQPILDVYECAIIRNDPAWYSETLGITRMQQRIREDQAVTSFMRRLPDYLCDLKIENYVQAPIVEDSTWKSYVSLLPQYSGNAIAAEDEVFHLQAML